MARPVFIYSFAASLDGFVADPKGGVKWLDAFHDADYGLEEFFRSIDALVMGRKTYEVALKLGGLPPMGKARVIVLSRKMKQGKHKVEIWHESLKALARDLEWQGTKRVWMMGGGETASSFLEAGLLDEVEIVTMPVVLGAGIPMFSDLKKPIRFDLVKTRDFPNGAVMRYYRRSAKAPQSATRPARKRAAARA